MNAKRWLLVLGFVGGAIAALAFPPNGPQWTAGLILGACFVEIIHEMRKPE